MIETYHRASEAVEELRLLHEKSELWVSGPLTLESAECRSVLRILSFLSGLCDATVPQERLGQNQNLLQNLNAHGEVLQVLRTPFHAADEGLTQIFRECHRFLVLVGYFVEHLGVYLD